MVAIIGVLHFVGLVCLLYVSRNVEEPLEFLATLVICLFFSMAILLATTI